MSLKAKIEAIIYAAEEPVTLNELAEFMLALGCVDAMNLDGGGSTTLVHRGHLLNRPYSTQDQPAPASRTIVSALAFEPQGRED